MSDTTFLGCWLLFVFFVIAEVAMLVKISRYKSNTIRTQREHIALLQSSLKRGSTNSGDCDHVA